jgi:hypothetical protein
MIKRHNETPMRSVSRAVSPAADLPVVRAADEAVAKVPPARVGGQAGVRAANPGKAKAEKRAARAHVRVEKVGVDRPAPVRVGARAVQGPSAVVDNQRSAAAAKLPSGTETPSVVVVKELTALGRERASLAPRRKRAKKGSATTPRMMKRSDLSQSAR